MVFLVLTNSENCVHKSYAYAFLHFLFCSGGNLTHSQPQLSVKKQGKYAPRSRPRALEISQKAEIMPVRTYSYMSQSISCKGRILLFQLKHLGIRKKEILCHEENVFGYFLWEWHCEHILQCFTYIQYSHCSTLWYIGFQTLKRWNCPVFISYKLTMLYTTKQIISCNIWDREVVSGDILFQIYCLR